MKLRNQDGKLGQNQPCERLFEEAVNQVSETLKPNDIERLRRGGDDPFGCPSKPTKRLS